MKKIISRPLFVFLLSSSVLNCTKSSGDEMRIVEEDPSGPLPGEVVGLGLTYEESGCYIENKKDLKVFTIPAAQSPEGYKILVGDRKGQLWIGKFDLSGKQLKESHIDRGPMIVKKFDGTDSAIAGYRTPLPLIFLKSGFFLSEGFSASLTSEYNLRNNFFISSDLKINKHIRQDIAPLANRVFYSHFWRWYDGSLLAGSYNGTSEIKNITQFDAEGNVIEEYSKSEFSQLSFPPNSNAINSQEYLYISQYKVIARNFVLGSNTWESAFLSTDTVTQIFQVTKTSLSISGEVATVNFDLAQQDKGTKNCTVKLNTYTGELIK